MKIYPSYVFNENENITRMNMAEYDRKKNIYYKKIEEIERKENRKLSLIERNDLYEEIVKNDLYEKMLRGEIIENEQDG